MSYTVALVGNPNAGKTTLFNALCGTQQKVGNWPGVTVECKTACMRQGDSAINLVDLPGCYALNQFADIETGTGAIDQKITLDYLHHESVDLIVNVIDGANLERNLYLTTQLLELGVPVLLAVNMMDVAKRRGLEINLAVLSEQLACPVVSLEACRGKGISELRQAIRERCAASSTDRLPNKSRVAYPLLVEKAVSDVQEIMAPTTETLKQKARTLALSLLEGDLYATQYVSPEVIKRACEDQQTITTALDEDVDIIIADARYQTAHAWVQAVCRTREQRHKALSQSIDDVVLHRFIGIPFFLAVMYAMFFFAINMGGVFQDFFDMASGALLVDGLSQLLQQWHFPQAFIMVLAGLGKGINTTVTFIPVLAAMFLFLSILETSGYMARAAFIVDRAMRAIGLPGKAFVPMIVGFGCNVPAVMAARTLDNRKDRILTVMMSPFMSCSARLAIYAVFTALFFPVGGQNIVFALYVIGILAAIGTGLLLRRTLLPGPAAPLVMELPPYHLPSLPRLFRQTWRRLKGFLWRAGKVIVPVCLILGVLENLPAHSGQTVLASLGQGLTPLFAPMGISQDNWPATVGLLTGTVAKEVVIATLNTLYLQLGHLANSQTAVFDLWSSLQAAFATIPEHIKALPEAFSNPILASMPEHHLEAAASSQMLQRFGSQHAAFAYLLFVLLYVPCISTSAVMARELNKGWALLSVAWSLFLAYGLAVLYYQWATWSLHPTTSFEWIVGLSALLTGFVLCLRYYGSRGSNSRAEALPC